MPTALERRVNLGAVMPYLPPETWIVAAIALLLGILLGWLVWGRALGRQQRVAFSLAQAQASIESGASDRTRIERELASSRDQIKPLADEVDRLRRELARAQRAAEPAAVPVARPESPALGVVTPIKTIRAVPVKSERSAPTDLRALKGVGDKLAARLEAVGVRDIPTLAALPGDEAQRVDAELGPFAGRIARDQLVEQARLLDEGRVTEYEARFGRLGS